jgi:hypothetical protein
MTSKLKGVWIAAVFLVGCAVGGASSRLMVPTAAAQQPAPVVQPPPGAMRWEYFCEEAPKDPVDQTNAANVWGADYWELTAELDMHKFTGASKSWCFKRPHA